MKSKILLLRVMPPCVGLLVSGLWMFLTHTYGPHGDRVAPATLALWWKITFAYFALLFVAFALGLFVFFYKRLDPPAFLGSVANLFTVCLIFALYFVTSEFSARQVISDIGLDWLQWWLLIIGIILSVVFFYVFARNVDDKARREARARGMA